MTSKDWPEVRLLSSMTSMSEITHQFKSTVSAEEGKGAVQPICHNAGQDLGSLGTGPLKEGGLVGKEANAGLRL